MSNLDVLLGRVEEKSAEESEKQASEGGLLDSFYQEAEKIAAEEGLSPEEAIEVADKVMETKVAMASMRSEINRIQGAREADQAYDPALEVAASYAPLSGPYAGILNSLQNRSQ